MRKFLYFIIYYIVKTSLSLRMMLGLMIFVVQMPRPRPAQSRLSSSVIMSPGCNVGQQRLPLYQIVSVKYPEFWITTWALHRRFFIVTRNE